MTKEEYIVSRYNNDDLLPVYHFYKEECAKKGYSFLEKNQFLMLFNIWPDTPNVVYNVIAYYNIKFEICVIQDLKTSQILKIL